MEHVDVLVVGGGPAGSTCAARLQAAKVDVLVVDKAQFPRPKLCAGWITPAVLEQLGLTAEAYRREGRVLQPMTGFRIGWIGGTSLTIPWSRPVSYGIRRVEFDDYLLRRSGSPLALGESIKTIRRDNGGWIVNERWQTRLLVAAGGHFCPVAKLLGVASHNRSPLIASQELEIELSETQLARSPIDPETPEIYFSRDLLGYGWCIRKGNYLNVGLGRDDGDRLPGRVAEFFDELKRQGRIPDDLPCKCQGHMYLLYDHATRPLVDNGVVWVGDAAGLAYSQSGEGIRPAIESGWLAAEAILAARGDYRREYLDLYRRWIELRFGPRRRTPVRRSTSRLRSLAARWLLRRPWFVRDVLLDSWFLRAGQPPLESIIRRG